MEEVSSTPVCNSCGACCRNFPFVKVLQSDIDRLEASTGLNSRSFSNIDEIDSNKIFMKFSEEGDCVFLKKVEGSYVCGAYEARPSICRAYPANSAEKTGCRISSKQEIIVNMSEINI
jgi:Fe-S-cluster containining protein